MVDENKEDKKPVKKCPQCGSEERIGETIIKQLKAEGVLGENFPAMLMFKIPMMDPEKMKASVLASLTNQVKMNQLQVGWDICANPECGAMYCVGAELVQQLGTVQMQQSGQPPQKGMPPFKAR